MFKMIFDPNCQISDYAKFFKGGMLLDTSPLLLYFIGEYDKRNKSCLIEKWSKGDKYYTLLDYECLNRFLSGVPFEKLCITPHIFHEVYKHLQKLLNNQFYDFFRLNTDLLIKLTEKHVNKNDLMTHPFFEKLEIGRLSLCLSKEKEQFCAILTDEERQTSQTFEKDKEVLIVFIKDVITYMNNI